MEMSKSCLPPRPPLFTNVDEQHPLFPLYRKHLNSCQVNLVQAQHFADWLYQYERQLESAAASRHEKYPAFLTWMKENRGGARPSPVGGFPHNFFFWIEGGRW